MNKWVFCPNCKHKMFLVDMRGNVKLEIKCHSCKSIANVFISNGKIKAEVIESEKA